MQQSQGSVGKEKIRGAFSEQINGCSFRLGEPTARRDGENSETDTWLDFAKDCGYISNEVHERLTAECKQVGAMLGKMLNNSDKFLLKS